MKRNENNPLITRNNIPGIPPHLVDVTSVFNPGAVMYNDKYLLLLRIQNRGRKTFWLKAISDDGLNFEIDKKIIELDGIEKINETIHHVYDPRITKIDDVYYIMFAMDLERDCRLGLARTNDFEEYKFLGIVSDQPSRNGVLFPEKFKGKYLRTERPNNFQIKDGPITGNSIIISESSDLLNWEPKSIVAEGRKFYWDELIGSGPPPVKTRKGWLQLYHGVATHFNNPVYQLGVLLLDLEDPGKVISRSTQNILEPRELYEMVGQVPNVVFPSGMIVEEFDERGYAKESSEVKIYYGAADTCVGLATTTIQELLNECFN
ncbi:MAG: glycoside hydrolase family 130 protein [Melioribacteraceae bacterium]|nr:glycoside hydrolase family 130 protein [Melioribacteraceae bacterium]MCF8356337.1 glycoside hydrolase family 130 protein [Melioribacteraceae bacterium]MCF8395746.1 glycoside hydrolase family 130 protein [Melioribacteraceae bacterium]MCF8420548.1 glycoside hydrolase family 130 protein [Melioribacteraceae bacterium]